MTLRNGSFLPYTRFRVDLGGRKIAPVIWGWRELQEALGLARDKELAGMSLLALSRNEGVEGCETTPGLSLSIQSLQASRSTPVHAHAWWHIFVVLGGTGKLELFDQQEEKFLCPNEIIFIPAWCIHSVRNSGNEDFTMLNISNMIQQSELSNFISS